MLEIQCPQCQRVLKVPEKYVGTEGACNYCGGRIEVQPAPVTAPVSMPASAAPPDSAESLREIERLTAALDSERNERERIEQELADARAQIAQLEAGAAEAEQQRESAARSQLDTLEEELARARGQIEALNKELEVYRAEKARADAGIKQSEARLADIRERLLACLDDLPERPEPEVRCSPVAAPNPISADAAALLVGGGKKASTVWMWLLGFGLALVLGLAAAVAFFLPRAGV